MSLKPLLPTSYVNTPVGPVYDQGLPDPLFRTYVRLRGLAWRSRGTVETPALTILELAEICHQSERSMWRHLALLRERTDLNWSILKGSKRFVLRFQPLPHQGGPEESDEEGDLLPKLALGVVPTLAVPVVVDHDHDQQTDQQQQDPDLLPKLAVDADLLPSLAVDPDLLPNLTVGEGPRRAGGPEPPLEPAAPAPLPARVLERLRLLGWSGDTSEVVLHVERDPGRVDRLLEYWLASDDPRVKNRAALFRADLRAGTVPATREEREQARRRASLARYAGLVQGLDCAAGEGDEYDEYDEDEYDDDDEYDECDEGEQGAAGTAEAGNAGGSPASDPEGEARARLWDQALADLRLQMTQATFDTCLAGSRLLGRENGTLLVGVRSAYACEWLSARLHSTLLRTLRRLAGQDVTVKCVVMSVRE